MEKKTIYNDTVLGLFSSPRYIGELHPCSAKGSYTSDICGHTAFFSLQIDSDVIQEIRFEMFGCAAAIASCSMLASLVKGISLADAKKFVRKMWKLR